MRKKNGKKKIKAGLRGFTLTELAITLGVAGLVVSAIWAAADKVWENYRLNAASQQILTVVQNIRQYYVNSPSLPDDDGSGTINIELDKHDLFPPEMRRDPTLGPGDSGQHIDSPFNHGYGGSGSFWVQKTSSTSFSIALHGLDQGPCIRLMTLLPLQDAELGISYVGTQNGNTDISNGNAVNASVTFPINAQLASSWCNNTAGDNTVTWGFLLRK